MRTERDWKRLGSEALSEDRRAGNDTAIGGDDLVTCLEYHFGDDLDNPEICEDRAAALVALVDGYRNGG